MKKDTQRNELGPYGCFSDYMVSETEGFRCQVSGFRCQEEEELNTFQPIGSQAGDV